jgi:hypothetical protein
VAIAGEIGVEEGLKARFRTAEVCLTLTSFVILNPCLKEVVFGAVDSVENSRPRRSDGKSSVSKLVDDRA